MHQTSWGWAILGCHWTYPRSRTTLVTTITKEYCLWTALLFSSNNGGSTHCVPTNSGYCSWLWSDSSLCIRGNVLSEWTGINMVSLAKSSEKNIKVVFVNIYCNIKPCHAKRITSVKLYICLQHYTYWVTVTTLPSLWHFHFPDPLRHSSLRCHYQCRAF